MDKELEEAIAGLNPPLPEFTEADHRAAMYRFVIDLLMSEIVSASVDLRKDDVDTKKLSQELWDFTTAPGEDGTDEGWIIAFAKKNNWELFREALNEFHFGDCTAFASTCTRCYVEQFYLIDTAPPGKSVGHKWDTLYLKHQKEKDNESV